MSLLNKMNYYPIFLNMQKKKIIILGGDESALQKTRLLLKTVAEIHVVSDIFVEELYGYASESKIKLINTNNLTATNVNDYALVFYSPESSETHLTRNQDEKIALIKEFINSAKANNILINTIDQPHDCDFFTPSIVDRAPLTIAIGTEGVAPVMGQKVKTHIEVMLNKNLGKYLSYAKKIRPSVMDQLKSSRDRRTFWRKFYQQTNIHNFFNNLPEFNQTIDRQLNQQLAKTNGKHHISFLEILSNDIEDMTIKSVRKLQDADIIIFDNKINHEVLEYARRDAERINLNATEKAKSHYFTALAEHKSKDLHIVRIQSNLGLSSIREEISELNQFELSYDITSGATTSQLNLSTLLQTNNKNDNITQVVA